MCKKYPPFFIIFLFCLLINTKYVYAKDLSINLSNVEKGVVSIDGSVGDKKTAVRIEKDGKSYDYVMSNTNINSFPLQMGNGEYTIQVLENIVGTKFKVSETKKITVSTLTDEKVYANPIQMIDFNAGMQSIVNLNLLASDKVSKDEKATVFYNFITENISYDTKKAQNISAYKNYLPVLDTVYSTKEGICYDYSSLFAGILRQNGIPTKLQMGYSTEIPEYHAWTEAFIDGKWIKIDTTYDAQALLAGVKVSMAKDDGMFTVVKEY